MDSINLQQTLPEVFAGRDAIHSSVWHRQVSFKKGETYLVEAASGTGKSSLCSYLYGSRSDYQGIITFDQTNIRNLSTAQWTQIRKRHISHLFQDLRLFVELSVRENIQLKNQLTGFKSKKEINALLNELGIADKVNSPVAKLSFGQQQRVAFIRALCQPADFFMLDEPISHLDEDNAGIMGTLLLREAKAQGAGVIVTSIGKHIGLLYNHVFKL